MAKKVLPKRKRGSDPDAAIDEIFGTVGQVRLTDELIVELLEQGWSESQLRDAQREGAVYSTTRKSILYPLEGF